MVFISNCFVSILLLLFSLHPLQAVAYQVPQEDQKGPKKVKLIKNGITVFTRPVKGYDTVEFGGNVIVPNYNGLEKKFLGILKSLSNYPSWSKSISYGCRLDKSADQKSWLGYMVFSNPLIQDRDVVAKFSVSRTTTAEGYKELNINSNKVYGIPKKPHNQDKIEVPYLFSTWSLTYLPYNKVRISLRNLTHPGGNVPSWIINLVIVEEPYKALTNIRNLLKKE